MSFTTKRGRPITGKTANLRVIEGGKPNSKDQAISRPKLKIAREAIDIYHEKGLINDGEHRCAIHFRWLYTIKFGAPGISAVNLDSQDYQQRNPDQKWQEEREKEYAMAVEKLRNCGALKIVLNIAVFGLMPKYMQPGRLSRGEYIRHNFTEVLKLREGLDILAKHWEKKS